MEESKDLMKDMYQLWIDCFGDTKEYTDFYFKWKVEVTDTHKKNKILTIHNGDILVSMLHRNPYTIRLRGREILCDYIVGVATKQTYRKSGYMRQILTKALQDMYHERKEFTYLMPAAERIYTPYSFRYVYTQERLEGKMNKNIPRLVDSEKIVSVGNDDISTYSFDKLIPIEGKLKELVLFTNRILEEYFQCYTKRDEFYYERMAAEMKSCGGELIVLLQKEKVIGYFSFMKDKNEIEVVETIIKPELKEEGIRSVINYLKLGIEVNPYLNSDSKISYSKDTEQPLTVRFLESYFIKDITKYLSDVKIKATPIIMARIVHFEEFISHINIKGNEVMTLILRVIDPDITQNEGIYRLQFSSTGCNVDRTDEGEELTLTISDLTSLLIGEATIEEVLESKDITYTEIIEKWNLINKYQNLFINEIV